MKWGGFHFHTSVSQKWPGDYYHLQGLTNGWIPTNTDSNSLFSFIMETSRKYFTPKNAFSSNSQVSENSHNYSTAHTMFGNFTEDAVC